MMFLRYFTGTEEHLIMCNKRTSGRLQFLQSPWCMPGLLTSVSEDPRNPAVPEIHRRTSANAGASSLYCGQFNFRRTRQSTSALRLFFIPSERSVSFSAMEGCFPPEDHLSGIQRKAERPHVLFPEIPLQQTGKRLAVPGLLSCVGSF